MRKINMFCDNHLLTQRECVGRRESISKVRQKLTQSLLFIYFAASFSQNIPICVFMVLWYSFFASCLQIVHNLSNVFKLCSAVCLWFMCLGSLWNLSIVDCPLHPNPTQDKIPVESRKILLLTLLGKISRIDWPCVHRKNHNGRREKFSFLTILAPTAHALLGLGSSAAKVLSWGPKPAPTANIW